MKRMALSLGWIVVLFASSCLAPAPSPTPTSQASVPTASPTVLALPSPTVTAQPQREPFLCQIDGPEVYLVFDAERHHIADWETFLNLGFEQASIRVCGASAAYPESYPITRWLKGSSEPVYWIESGLRRHIPDMETFRALGYQEQDITVVPDALLEIWPIGGPMPSVQATPPAQAMTTVPTSQSTATLRDELKAIHDAFEIDPTKGCFELQSPYPEYHKGLQQMTVLLLTDPRVQGLGFAEREALFEEVTGFDGVRFMAGNGEATLVQLRTYRGHTAGCSSHDRSPDALYVVAPQGTLHDIGTEGTLVQTWWIDDRWIALLRLKMDSSTGPTRWAVWHIGQLDAAWQRLVTFEITPTPYNFVSLPLHFKEGYQVMIADVDHWWADDPCEFTAEFKDAYEHGTWQVRRTYHPVGDTYELVSSEVVAFTVQRKGTGEQVTLQWQDYCAGPIR